MRNNFQKFLTSEYPPHGNKGIFAKTWKYAACMLLAFILAIGNVWAAASSAIPETPDYKDISTVATDGTYTFTCSSENIKNAASATSSWIGWYSTQSSFKEYNKSGSATCMGAQTSIPNLKYDKVYFYVTNCTSFEIQAWGNGDNRHVNYSYQATDAASATEDSFTSANNQTCASSGEISLDASKSYTIIVWNGTDEIGVTYMVFNTSTGGDPVAPEFTYTPATYTIGDPALDLSTKVTSTNTTGAITFAVSTADAGTTGASIANGKNFTATTAGTAKITVSQAASTGYNAKTQDIEVTVAAPALAVCPSGLTISGTAAYTEGETISLTAALSEGNGEITYTWYKGDDLATAKAAGSIGTGASFSKASCTTGDAGNYFCVASKDACSDAESAAYPVTVAPVSYCAELYPATSGASPTAKNQALLLQSEAPNASYGGKIYTAGAKDNNWSASFTYSANGLSLNKGGADSARVELTHLMKAGTVITVTLVNPDASKARGYKLLNMAKTTKATWQATTTDPQVYTYTVVEGDGLAGTNMFLLQRAETSALKELKVSNCGAELHELTSEVSVAGKGTVTLSKSLLAEGATATATYSSIDPAYDFDEWVISGAGATLSSTTANPTTITMGSADAVVTLKLKEKAGFAVTYKANNGTEEADVVVSKESTFAANAFTVPDGKMFAGWNTQADGEGTNYAVGDAVTAAIIVYAKWVVDPTIRLILKSGDTYSINTDKFTVYEGTELQNEEYTVDGRAFAKNFKFGGTCSSTPFASQAWSNKFMAYDVTSNSTDIKLYIYNKNTSNKKLYYQIVPEGSAAAAFQSVTITSKATNQVVSIPTITAAKGARVLFGIESTDVRICQIEVLENGTALPAFGTNGYEFSVPGRAATNNKTGAFDGFEFKTNADLKFINGQDHIALRNIDGSQYVKFTVATNIQLQVTTPNANKFYVSKTAAGDAENDTQYGGSAATHNVNLHAGTYYIAPTVGSSGGEVQITKLAFATAPAVKTVTFDSDGGSSVEAQEVFAGEKAVEPTTPTKDGYRFVEWQLSGSAYDFDEAVTVDITLDAVWQETVTITFDPNNTEATFTRTVDKGAKIATDDIPANPTYAGYDFQGWTTDLTAEPIVHVDLSATTFSEATTLKAHWEVAQDDATLSALSYNGNAIDVASAEDVSGVQTYTYHLPWGSTIDPALISVTKNAESATMNPINYDSENKQATFQVTSGNGLVSVNYAIQFVIDAKRGTSIIKATTNNVITGIIGGTRGTNLGNGDTKKLNSNTYFGVTLANDETFQEGDVFIVNITTPADLGKFMIYADAERTELIADQGIVYTKPDVADPVICPTGEMMMTLPAAANGKKSLYLSREDGTTQWNPVFSYVEVTREMNPAIKSFKFGEDAATINEAAKTITYEVAYGTDVTALTPTVEAYGNNGATYTPDGATDFTTSVNYVVTDAYGELSTTYAVTVNVAAPSTNAYLASLSVAGYTLDFNKEVEEYNIVLDYGTTVLPEITYAVEDVGLATAVKVEGGVNGATTITVTPQAGAGYEKVYTINFSVSTTPKFVIYDGQKSDPMSAIATSGSDVSTGFAWTITGASNTDASNGELSFEDKTYSKYVNLFTSATKAPDAGNTRYITITIPDGYFAKFRLVGCGNGAGSRSSFISKEITGTLDQSIVYATTTANNVLDGRTSALQLPGTYYYCADASIRLYELSVQLYPIDYSRATTEGRYGTICLPNGGVMVGAELYEVAYYDGTYEKIFFDEVLNGEMVAGRPYIFLTKEGVNQIAVYYTDEENAPEGNYHGLFGSYTRINLAADDHIYILKDNRYYFVDTDNVYCGENRAYFKMGVADGISGSYVAPAPGRRRTSIGAGAPAVATGIDQVPSDQVPSTKVIIDGHLYILRGEKMYDAKGQLVK